LRNFLEDVFKKTTDDIWFEGFSEGVAWEKQLSNRKAALMRDLLNANWDFPKGTRREEAVSLMIEQCAQIAESSDEEASLLANRSHV
jgi:hypothetical protein